MGKVQVFDKTDPSDTVVQLQGDICSTPTMQLETPPFNGVGCFGRVINHFVLTKIIASFFVFFRGRLSSDTSVSRSLVSPPHQKLCPLDTLQRRRAKQ